MAKKEIKVIYVEPHKAPEVKVIANNYETLNKCVGGYIEILHLRNDICIVCNEEGKLIPLEPNRRLWNDVICGSFLICKDDGRGDFKDLTENDITYYTNYFADIPDIDASEVECKFEIFTW